MADDWMFDSIVQFLKCPLWVAPVQSFIDEHCAMFDGTKENPHEYNTVHAQFCELVDKVLSEFLGEMGVSPEQFVTACKQGENKQLNALVSEYILALDDFGSFKSMMEKRNVELELEAMKYVKFGENEAGEVVPPAADEDADLKAAIAASIADDDVLAQQLKMEEAQLAHALALSLAMEEESTKKAKDEAATAEEKVKIDKEHQEEVTRIKASFAAETVAVASASATATAAAAKPSEAPAPVAPAGSALVVERPSTAQKPTLGSVGLHRHTTFGAAKAPLPGIASAAPKAPEPAAPAPAAPKPAAAAAGGPSADEIKKRQEYLKAQRDRLVANQKAAREKELQEYMKKKEGGSAPAAKAEPKMDDQDKSKMRDALGARFREDLINETRQAALREAKA